MMSLGVRYLINLLSWGSLIDVYKVFLTELELYLILNIPI